MKGCCTLQQSKRRSWHHLYQSAIKTAPHRHSHRPTWSRCLLNRDSLLRWLQVVSSLMFKINQHTISLPRDWSTVQIRALRIQLPARDGLHQLEACLPHRSSSGGTVQPLCACDLCSPSLSPTPRPRPSLASLHLWLIEVCGTNSHLHRQLPFLEIL